MHKNIHTYIQYVCKYAITYVPTYVRLYVCTCIYTYKHTFIQTYVCTYVCMSVYVRETHITNEIGQNKKSVFTVYVCLNTCMYVCSVLHRMFRVVAGFYIAFSAVYLNSVSVAYIQFVLSEWWLIHLSIIYSRQVPTSVGRTLSIYVCMYVHMYVGT